MAFCNSCGSVIEAGVRFCPKCGKPTGAAAAAPQGVVPPPSPMAPAPVPTAQPVAATTTTGGSGVLKVILIVVAVIFVIGVLAVGTIGYFAHRVYKSAIVHDSKGHTTIKSPIGDMETSDDPDQAAKDLGVDVYPGSSVVKGSAASVSFGKARTSGAQFDTNDPPASVAEFYKSKYPGAMFSSSETNHFSLVAGGKNDITTINIQPEEGKTRIAISRITGKGE
jgi:hypothetical protein